MHYASRIAAAALLVAFTGLFTPTAAHARPAFGTAGSWELGGRFGYSSEHWETRDRDSGDTTDGEAIISQLSPVIGVFLYQGVELYVRPSVLFENTKSGSERAKSTMWGTGGGLAFHLGDALASAHPYLGLGAYKLTGEMELRQGEQKGVFDRDITGLTVELGVAMRIGHSALMRFGLSYSAQDATLEGEGVELAEDRTSLQVYVGISALVGLQAKRPTHAEALPQPRPQAEPQPQPQPQPPQAAQPAPTKLQPPAQPQPAPAPD